MPTSSAFVAAEQTFASADYDYEAADTRGQDSSVSQSVSVFIIPGLFQHLHIGLRSCTRWLYFAGIRLCFTSI